MRQIVFIAFLLGSISWSVQAQTADDLKGLLSVVAVEEEVHHRHDRNYDNEYDWFIGELFFVYKQFVSSQDGNTCTFTPSCSTYGVQAIREQGVVIGTINFFDRFSRCHGLNSEDYEFDSEHNLLIDPVLDHKFH